MNKSTTPQADAEIKSLSRACDALADAAFALDVSGNPFAKIALITVEEILDDVGEECDRIIKLRAKLREINNGVRN